MQLSDFYYADKHEAGTRMPIMTPAGEETGEWLQVRGPDCDTSIQAGRAYSSAIRALDDMWPELQEKCKETGNFSEWNARRGYEVENLNKQLAVELVTGWSFDNKDGEPEVFSKEAFMGLMKQFRGLAEQVCKHHTDSRDELNAK